MINDQTLRRVEMRPLTLSTLGVQYTLYTLVFVSMNMNVFIAQEN